jgi:alcohol dehydrogenase class IV
MRFEFATAARILFGTGTLTQTASAASQIGRRVLLVIGKSAQRAGRLIDSLTGSGLPVKLFHVESEPTVETALAGVEAARRVGCDLVVGLGGGSALDAGKAIAALLTNPGEPLDYLEVVGKGQPLVQPPAPYIAIPTTAGTGAEVTRNAVLAVPEKRVKVSLRSPLMLPRLAIIDPELTYGLPPDVTASTGLDALTQLIEPFLSNASNPLTDSLCREGIQRAARSLRKACQNGADPQAREDMCLASLFGGLALANAKLGAAHGLAAPLGGMFPSAPHGALCARLLPFVLETNLAALQERAPDSPTLARFDEIARLLTGKPKARAEDGLRWLKQVVKALKIPALKQYGIQTSDVPEIIAQAQKASSMKGNPIELSESELGGILAQALQPDR